MPSVEEVQKSLKQALERLEVSHDNEEKELRQVKSSISTAESNAEALRKQLNATSEDVSVFPSTANASPSPFSPKKNRHNHSLITTNA